MRVSGQQFGQQGFDAAAEFFFFLAQPQQSQRADQRRFDVVALRLGFLNLRDQVGGINGKLGVGVPFGHDVVVVGVEPLGHFHRKLGGVAACQLEILRQAQFGGVEAEAFGNCAQGAQGVEHVVVEGKIADGHEIRACGFLRRPVQTADFGGGFAQLGFGFGAFPKGFDGEFQLAFGTDARVAGKMEGGH